MLNSDELVYWLDNDLYLDFSTSCIIHKEIIYFVWSLLFYYLESLEVSVDVVVHAVRHFLVLDWAKYFVGACLIADLLETCSKHFGFEAIDIFML